MDNVGIEDEVLADHTLSPLPLTCRKNYRAHNLGLYYGESPLQYSFSLILSEIVFVIFTTWIVRFLLKPLRQPRIVSEIIGGIIIGPSILGRNKNFAETMFPETAQYVLRNIGIIGFMYFLFVSGVRMDIALIKRSGRKEVYIAFFGVTLPTVTVIIVGLLTRQWMDEEFAKISSIGAISTSLSITSFPVLYLVLKEMNLLCSEVGRISLSTSVVSGAIGINANVVFEAIKQGEVNGKNALWYLISLVVLFGFFATAVQRAMLWIVDRTPEGKPVGQGYVVGILLGVMVMGFLTDMFGMAIANGPLWLGLVIPDGPPLGATLVERTETFIMEFLMPFSFAVVGLYTNVYAMTDLEWLQLAPITAMVLTAYATKIIGTLLPSLVFEMPFRDSLALSLMMSLRGQVELLLFIHWMDKKIIEIPSFSLLVLSTIAITGIAAPMISFLYDPTRPYMVNKRRTIQHHPPNTELRLVVCIHDPESVGGLINFLEVSYPTLSSPFSVYALHLIELVGRGVPVFVDYENKEEPDKYTSHDSVHNALKQYGESREELKFHTFTTLAPMRSMYQDICELALENSAALIMLPYHKEYPSNLVGTEVVRAGVNGVNASVLDHAPCSVGILIDKGNFRNPFTGCSVVTQTQSLAQQHQQHHFVMLFLGGPDSREALTYADRMAANPDVTLTVIRFLASNHEGEDEMEKKLDDGVVTWFWVKNEINERVIYREVVVRNGAETVTTIQALNDDAHDYDLWIVGRRQGISPVVLEGLEEWSEENELGLIGDFIASPDFLGLASILVMQQQVMRGQGKQQPQPSEAARQRKFPCTSILSQF